MTAGCVGFRPPCFVFTASRCSALACEGGRCIAGDMCQVCVCGCQSAGIKFYDNQTMAFRVRESSFVTTKWAVLNFRWHWSLWVYALYKEEDGVHSVVLRSYCLFCLSNYLPHNAAARKGALFPDFYVFLNVTTESIWASAKSMQSARCWCK